MCTYQTEKLAVSGSAKGAAGWLRVGEATVYLDHPAHAPEDHTLNIDFFDWSRQPVERVAVELEPESARRLAEAILSAVERAGALA